MVSDSPPVLGIGIQHLVRQGSSLSINNGGRSASADRSGLAGSVCQATCTRDQSPVWYKTGVLELECGQSRAQI
jgi:hypothetical protein